MAYIKISFSGISTGIEPNRACGESRQHVNLITRLSKRLTKADDDFADSITTVPLRSLSPFRNRERVGTGPGVSRIPVQVPPANIFVFLDAVAGYDQGARMLRDQVV